MRTVQRQRHGHAGGVRLRFATAEDASALCAIYAPIVEETAISFELEPPDEAEMRRRIVNGSGKYPWVVAERSETSEVLGYAYASSFRARAAYDRTTELTIYIDDAARGGGVGRRLYGGLIAIVKELGYAQAIGGIALPNPRSVALHESLDFRHVGTFARVGHKHGAWHDLGFWARHLVEGSDERPPRPRTMREVDATRLEPLLRPFESPAGLRDHEAGGAR